ncbi:ComEC/Rec2 family competence protein [Candidatus Cytomitobacter primus]|uniref:ComEC/Rec2 family competence protein n=1 Tax=Candidatus Cytomitobacter primus TaxID=2066024 RepID=A0A5C0UEV3_9PROT|nr:ComEC/Rec2 family competence protein [Candidatus Cytomitobacter primus]QEK38626.1 ComEC/Rec2 family competence protein [Candidatus Cytomitobacter primus]
MWILKNIVTPKIPIHHYPLFWLLIGKIIGIGTYLICPTPTLLFLIIPIGLLYFVRKNITIFLMFGLILGFARISHKIYSLKYDKPTFTYFDGIIHKIYRNNDRCSVLVKLNDSKNFIRIKLDNDQDLHQNNNDLYQAGIINEQTSNPNSYQNLNSYKTSKQHDKHNYHSNCINQSHSVYSSTNNNEDYNRSLKHHETYNENLQINNYISGHVQLYGIPEPCLPEAKDIRYKEYFSRVISYGNTKSYKIISSKSYLFSEKISKYIKANFKPIEASLFKSLLLGQSNEVPYKTKQAFQNASISHLLAISGLHIGLIALFCYALCRWGIYFFIFKHYKIPIIYISQLFSVIGIISYLFLIETSISAIRAIIMFLFPIMSYFSFRKTLPSHGLMSAIFILLMIWPESLLYPSFQFSCLAVFGLISFKSTYKNYFIKILSSTLICFLITAPFTIYWFNQIPIQPFLSNLICIPLMFIIMSLITFWVFLFKLNISFIFLNKIIALLLYWLNNLAIIFSDFLNHTILFHQIHYSALIFWVISLIIIANYKNYAQKIGLVFLLPFLFNIYNKPKNMFVISKNGEVALLQNSILYAKNDNFTTNCWAKTLGAKLLVGTEIDNHVQINKINGRVNTIKLRNRMFLSRQSFKNCPCKIINNKPNINYWS